MFTTVLDLYFEVLLWVFLKFGDLKKKSSAQPTAHRMRTAHVQVLDDGIILKVLMTVTLQTFDLERPTVPLWKDLKSAITEASLGIMIYGFRYLIQDQA